MNWFHPFRLITPAADKSHLVASRSYVTYGKAELRDKLERNPYSYLHVIHPSGTGTPSAKRGTEGFYQLVREQYESFKDRGWLQTVEGNCLAIYRQSTETHSCTGIIGTLSAEGITNGRLKLHEQTLKKRERIFAKYLRIVGCHAEPILCSYPDQNKTGQAINLLIEEKATEPASMDFSTTDRIRHTIWILDPKSTETAARLLNDIDAMYLADGHHRVASSLALAREYPHESAKQRVLSYAIPESQLVIKGYHREMAEVRWNKNEWEKALSKLPSGTLVEPTDSSASPASTGVIHLHTKVGHWKITMPKDHPTKVDADFVQEHMLLPFFHVADARNDARLRFLPGTGSHEELLKRLDDHEDRCIFELHPVSTEQIKSTADRGGFLPPKSTWIEPKLRSGLFIYEL